MFPGPNKKKKCVVIHVRLQLNYDEAKSVDVLNMLTDLTHTAM